MKKNELIEHMAVRAGISKASAQKAMEAFYRINIKISSKRRQSFVRGVWDMVCILTSQQTGTKSKNRMNH